MWMGNEISIEYDQLAVFEAWLVHFRIKFHHSISTFTSDANAAHTYDTFPWQCVRIRRPGIAKHRELNEKQYAALSIDFEANGIDCCIWWGEKMFKKKWEEMCYLWWCVLRMEELMWWYFLRHFTRFSYAFVAGNGIYVRYDRVRHFDTTCVRKFRIKTSVASKRFVAFVLNTANFSSSHSFERGQ